MPTKIEWADESWNPVTGCTKISEGCRNCYAERMARRLAGRFGYPEAPDHFRVTVHEDKMDQPLHWKKPRRILVCSMSDLFHADVPTWAIDIVFLNMRTSPQHTFLILTKRPRWMRHLLSGPLLMSGKTCAEMYPNVLLGVTVENADYLWRIDELFKIPAAGHFVSLEPMLGAVDLLDYFPRYDYRPTYEYYRIWAHSQGWDCGDQPIKEQEGLDWVIAGGESGPGARPMHPDNVRSVRDQCQESGTPFLFKQWGAWAPTEMHDSFALDRLALNYRGLRHDREADWMSIETGTVRVGKRAAGRLLDGREWDEYPEPCQ